MSASTRSAGVRRTASTRSSRAQARTTKQPDDVLVTDENFVENVKKLVEAPEAKPKIKSKSAGRKKVCDENVAAAKGKMVMSEKMSAPPTALPRTVTTSMLPPLSPSKSTTNNNNNNNGTRLPLSPVKRHNVNPPSSISSGFSPPKIMKNDENGNLARKGLASPTRVVPPQSPLRAGPPQSPLRAGPPQSPLRAGPPQSPLRAGPPQSPLRAGPPQSPSGRTMSPFGRRINSPAVTPRSLFSAQTKSSSTALSKPLRTSCQPASPLKSPPPGLHLANALNKNSNNNNNVLKSPVSVKRSNLFDEATPSTKPNPASDNVVLSPKTPRAATVEEKSPSKPKTSPGKPAPSRALTVTSSPTPKSASADSPPVAALGSPPTSPAESRLARLNLNAAPSPYAAARKAFHTSNPSGVTPSGALKGRETERKEIVDFIENHFKENKAGALYVSGAPGTGKTATLNTIINEYKATTKCLTIYINCMSIRNSSMIYAKILAEGSSSKSAAAPKGGSKGAQKAVEKLVTTKGKPILLFLDEMDQLGDANNQDVLYTLFEWTFTPGSRLVLVGVANALDLTERILPRLQAKAGRKPRTMNFAPYSQGQLMDILNDRLSTSSSAPTSADSSPAPLSLVDKSALLFCAKKIASVSGDARKALDACRYAVEMVEKSAESTPGATPFNTPTSGSGAATPSSALKKVGITHVMRVLSGVYENAAVATSAASKAPNSTSGNNVGGGTLTLQQKIIICCIVLVHKKGKNTKVVTVGKLQEVYKKVCQRKGFIPGMNESGGSDLAEFLSTLSNIEASGILTIKKEKVSRDSKVNLLLDETELEKALQDDRKMLATILQSDII